MLYCHNDPLVGITHHCNQQWEFKYTLCGLFYQPPSSGTQILILIFITSLTFCIPDYPVSFTVFLLTQFVKGHTLISPNGSISLTSLTLISNLPQLLDCAPIPALELYHHGLQLHMNWRGVRIEKSHGLQESFGSMLKLTLLRSVHWST